MSTHPLKEALVRQLVRIEPEPLAWLNWDRLDLLCRLLDLPSTRKHRDLAVATLRVLAQVDSPPSKRIQRVAEGKGDLGKQADVKDAARACLAERERRRQQEEERERLLRAACQPAEESILLHIAEVHPDGDAAKLLRADRTPDDTC